MFLDFEDWLGGKVVDLAQMKTAYLVLKRWGLQSVVDEGWESLDQFVDGKVFSCYGTVQVAAIGERKQLVAELSHTHHLGLRVGKLKVK